MNDSHPSSSFAVVLTERVALGFDRFLRAAMRTPFDTL
jgi:hypothetical protein